MIFLTTFGIFISRIIEIVISNPELISTLMVKENPKCVDGLILEAPAFKIHEATAKWYIILGTNFLYVGGSSGAGVGGAKSERLF